MENIRLMRPLLQTFKDKAQLHKMNEKKDQFDEKWKM